MTFLTAGGLLKLFPLFATKNKMQWREIYKLFDLFIYFKAIFLFFRFFTIIFSQDEREKKYMVKNRSKFKGSYCYIVLIT